MVDGLFKVKRFGRIDIYGLFIRKFVDWYMVWIFRIDLECKDI